MKTHLLAREAGNRAQNHRVTLHTIVAAAFAILALIPIQTLAQTSAPLAVAPPTWNRVMHMPDGRTFVTDGGFTVDAVIAKPATLPTVVIPDQTSKRYADMVTAPFDREVTLGELGAGARQNTFVTPTGLPLNGNYINVLRRASGASRMRLRIKGDLEPIVIVMDGKLIGVVMPMARPRP